MFSLWILMRLRRIFLSYPFLSSFIIYQTISKLTEMLNSCFKGEKNSAQIQKTRLKGARMGSTQENRPFLSSKISHFQNEANCKTFLVKMSLIRVTIKNRFHTNGFALSSPWNRGLGQHGNGLLKPIHCFQLKLKKRTNKAKQSKISRPLYSSLCGDNLDQYNLLLPWLSGNISCGQDNKFCFAIESGHVWTGHNLPLRTSCLISKRNNSGSSSFIHIYSIAIQQQ